MQSVKKQDSLELAYKVFDYSNDGILITDSSNNILMVNKKFEEITGFKNEEVVGKNPSILSSGYDNQKFYEEMWESLIKNNFWKGEVKDRKKDGTLYLAELSIAVIYDNEGNISNYVAVTNDITKDREKEKAINKLVYYDFLTNLPNRTFFKEKIEEYIKVSTDEELKFALLYLDLDNFKVINDSYGFMIGDELLGKVALILEHIIPKKAIVGRASGDEFIIFYNGYENLSELTTLAQDIIENLSHPFKLSVADVSIGCSVGIAQYPENSLVYDEIFQSASTAMNEAKKDGKNRFHFFSEEMNKKAIRRSQMEASLKKALKNKEFYLEYQPKYSNYAKNFYGMEALIRWNHPEKGRVSPIEFIPIAEDTHLIKDIGLWVIEQVFKDYKSIKKSLKRDMLVSVNVSAIQLNDEFIQRVEKLLALYKIETQTIELEITESSIMKNLEHMIVILNRLKTMGFKISIDDFGTGYSSMYQLKKLPVDILKIDKSFVDEVDKNSDDRAIFNAMIAMSKSLDITTVAEGVEDEQSLEIVRNSGCDCIQGYYYSKPLDIDKFIEFCKKHK